MVSNNKKPVCLISTDWHIKENNHQLIDELVDQQIELAKSLNIDLHFLTGDVFNVRGSQSLNNLLFFRHILLKFKKAGHYIFMFPGNHDKVNQEEDASYLDVYYNIGPTISVFKNLDYVSKNKIKFHLLPFYKEEIYISKLQSIKIFEGEFNVLLTHTAFQGSVNNDGASINNRISPKLFDKFDLVISGHYHNEQKINNKIFHIPSLYPSNFGENNNKGVTIIYDDLSKELRLLHFPKYETIKVDIDTLNSKQFNELIVRYSNIQDHIRFNIIGERSKVESFDFSKLKEADIAYKVSSTIELSEVIEDNTIVQGDNIVEMYEDFSQQSNSKVRDFTIKILKEVFNG